MELRNQFDRKKPLRGPSRQKGKSISCRPNGVAQKTRLPALTNPKTYKEKHREWRGERQGRRAATFSGNSLAKLENANGSEKLTWEYREKTCGSSQVEF